MTKVTVIICSKNDGNTIDLCLKSIIGQVGLFGDLEIIIVDAMSTDNTSKVIKRYSDRVKVIYDSGKSLTRARNIGLKNSSGDIIIHSDADLIWHPNAISNSLRYLQEGDDAIISNMGVLKGMGFWREVRSWEDVMRRFYGRLFQSSSVKVYGFPRIFKRQILEKVGGHNEEISFYGEDMELFWRLLKVGAKIKFAQDVGFYNIEENSIKKIWEKAYRYGQDGINLLKYNKKCIIELLGPFFMVIFPIIPIFFAIMGLTYSKSIKISIGLFLCNWIRMAAQAWGVTRKFFNSLAFSHRLVTNG